MKKTPDGIFSKTLPTTGILAILFTLDFLFQHTVRHLSPLDAVAVAMLNTVVYTGILGLTTRCDLARMTLCFLALPYLIFIPGWLNFPTAILLLIIFIYCMRSSLRSITAISHPAVTRRDFLAFLLILIWVNISGAGGYGFQWDDYAINNARLHDLVVNAWPVRYGENRNFVFYFGYFLPAALIGKLSSVDIAIHSMYAWTVLGITLTIRWLAYLAKWRFSIVLVLVFILFGPTDILNVFYVNVRTGLDWANVQGIQNTLDALNFTTSQVIGFFLGNYLSNVFGLYWSPQQIIAGWLCASLMMHLFLQNKIKHFLFVYGLLCLWGPLVMVALLPFVLLAILWQLSGKEWRAVFSIENTLGAGSLAMVFVIFYLGGSAAANPSFWLFTALDWHTQGDLLLVFYLTSWGFYALALIPFMLQCGSRYQLWFACLVFALAALPLRIFGEWSDLLCRGSAPLMFLLLVFLLKAIQHHYAQRNKIAVLLILCLLVSGTGSAIMINRESLLYYGQTRPVSSLPSYSNAYPNFGPDNTAFARWFRRELPAQLPAK